MGDKEEQRLLRAVQRGGAKPPASSFKPPPGPFGAPLKEDNRCAICTKTVYVNERVMGVSNPIHTKCFRCTTCSKSLTTATQYIFEGRYYCQADGKKVATHSRSPSGEVEVVKSTTHVDDPETEIRRLRSASYDHSEFSNHSSANTSGASTPVRSRSSTPPPEASPVIDSRSIMGTFGTHPGPIEIPNDISGDRETVDALLRASYGRNTTVMVKLKTDPVKEKTEEELALPPQVLAAVGNSGSGSTRGKRLSIKSDKCVSCGKSVYQLERVQSDSGKIYHKSCFKCSVCQLTLDLTNHATHEDKLYCENHYKNLKNLNAIAQFQKDKLLAEQEDQAASRKEIEARERETEKAIKTREEKIRNGQITTNQVTPTVVDVPIDEKSAADREERLWAQRQQRLQRAAMERQMNDPVEFERHREEEKKRVLALRTSGTAPDKEEREKAAKEEKERKEKEREEREREEHEKKQREENERKEKAEREEKERKEREENEEKEKKEKEEKEKKEKEEREEKERKAKEEEEKLKKEKEEKERLEKEQALQEKEKAEREAEEWEKIQQELRKKATEAAERFLREPEHGPASVTEESLPSQAPLEDETESEEESSDTISPSITPSHSSNSLLWVPLTPGLLTSSSQEPSEKSKEERKAEREQKRKEKEERRIRREERRVRRAAREERRKKRDEAAAQKKAVEQAVPVQ